MINFACGLGFTKLIGQVLEVTDGRGKKVEVTERRPSKDNHELNFQSWIKVPVRSE
jgi:hypothetical protein